MSNFEVNISPLDIARATVAFVGDVAIKLFQHLPTGGYPSSHGGGPHLDKQMYDKPGEVGGAAAEPTLT